MKALFHLIYMNYYDVTKMYIFNYFKTGDMFYDTIISTIFISTIGYIINYIYENRIDLLIYKLSYTDIVNWTAKKNMVIIEGRTSSVISSYSYTINTSTMYSDRFKAIWSYIISNINRLDTIHIIKETHSNFQSSCDGEDKRRQNLDIFMVSQNKCFEIDDGIFVKTEVEQEQQRNEKEKSCSLTDKIIIYIYSYKYSLSYLKNYIDNITYNYLSAIKEKRFNKKFIYTLERINTEGDQKSPFGFWREDIFESARTFNNIFFAPFNTSFSVLSTSIFIATFSPSTLIKLSSSLQSM